GVPRARPAGARRAEERHGYARRRRPVSHRQLRLRPHHAAEPTGAGSTEAKGRTRPMSPVFGHGRLRLYLLKLLEESPRHAYKLIRLLQDRFLGVYSPSPGTIYPRLAQLDEEGLGTNQGEQGQQVHGSLNRVPCSLYDL